MQRTVAETHGMRMLRAALGCWQRWVAWRRAKRTMAAFARRRMLLRCMRGWRAWAEDMAHAPAAKASEGQGGSGAPCREASCGLDPDPAARRWAALGELARRHGGDCRDAIALRPQLEGHEAPERGSGAGMGLSKGDKEKSPLRMAGQPCAALEPPSTADVTTAGAWEACRNEDAGVPVVLRRMQVRRSCPHARPWRRAHRSGNTCAAMLPAPGEVFSACCSA